MKSLTKIAAAVAILGGAVQFSTDAVSVDQPLAAAGSAAAFEDEKLDTPILNSEKLDTPILNSEKLDTPILNSEKLDTPILSPIDL